VSEKRPPNLLAGLRPKRVQHTAGARRAWIGTWLVIILVLSIALFLLPNGTARGVVGVLLVFSIVGGLVGWLTNAGRRISGSDRDPTDFVLPP
jgi:protein-S-isoprenylcysteine O-methyltransferase Ste14